MRTDVEKTPHLDDDVLVCNVENTQVTDEEIPYVVVCMKCDVESDLISAK